MAAEHATANSALRAATALPLERPIVIGTLDVDKRPADAVFSRAFAHGLTALDRAERGGALGGVTGHIAESVVEVILSDHGWSPVWDFVGPGRHGVDLLMLGPGAERLFAIEVKGTLRPRRWPHLRKVELAQMDVAWLDKVDNPAMQEWDVQAEGVYGAVAVVNFHDLAYKLVLTADFERWHPILDTAELDQLDQLDWLDEG
jgi:hypothetical protein